MAALVSVCVTTYNHEKWLHEALDSILAAECDFGVEILLGEDCSTDNTLAVCRRYAEQHPDKIRLITSERNVGWRENYHRLVEAAEGRYIAFCDGDDCWCDATRLRDIIALMESNPNIGMCYTLAERRDESGALVEYFPRGVGHTTLDTLLHDWCVENCTAVARREAVLSYYATEKPHTHPEWRTEDLPMWLYVAAHHDIAYIGRVTAVHRIFGESVSHSESLEKRLAFCDSSSNIKLWFDERYNNSRQRHYLLRERMNTALWVYSHIGSIGDFLRRWSDEIRALPSQIFNPKPYGLLLKKVLFRMWRKTI